MTFLLFPWSSGPEVLNSLASDEITDNSSISQVTAYAAREKVAHAVNDQWHDNILKSLEFAEKRNSHLVTEPSC